jgi:hypothetical protein
MEKYFTTKDGRYFIKQTFGDNDKCWGWYHLYGNKWRVCASAPQRDSVEEITREQFDALMFMEKL